MNNETYAGAHESDQTVEENADYTPRHLAKEYGTAAFYDSIMNQPDDAPHDAEKPESAETEFNEKAANSLAAWFEQRELELKHQLEQEELARKKFREEGLTLIDFDPDAPAEETINHLLATGKAADDLTCAKAFYAAESLLSQTSNYEQSENAFRGAINKYHGHDNPIIQIAKASVSLQDQNPAMSDELRRLAKGYGNFNSLDDCREELGLTTEDVVEQFASEGDILSNLNYIQNKIGTEKTLKQIDLLHDPYNLPLKLNLLGTVFKKSDITDALYECTRDFQRRFNVADFAPDYEKAGFSATELAESLTPYDLLRQENLDYFTKHGVEPEEILDYLASYIRIDYTDGTHRRIDKNHPAIDSHYRNVKDKFTGIESIIRHAEFIQNQDLGLDYDDIADAVYRYGGKKALPVEEISQAIGYGEIYHDGVALIDAFVERFKLSDKEAAKFYRSALMGAINFR